MTNNGIKLSNQNFFQLYVKLLAYQAAIISVVLY